MNNAVLNSGLVICGVVVAVTLAAKLSPTGFFGQSDKQQCVAMVAELKQIMHGSVDALLSGDPQAQMAYGRKSVNPYTTN